jgi:hypothetical protein
MTSRRASGLLHGFLALALTLLLAACQTPTPYQPSLNSNFGYSDEQLGQNRFRVSFVGNSATRRETVEDFLLLRSAEVTRNAGARWFLFDTRDTREKTSYFTTFNPYPWWGSPYGMGWYWHNWAYDNFDTMAVTRYEAYAEIILLTPEQAKKEPRALDADDVIAHLGPKATAPQK